LISATYEGQLCKPEDGFRERDILDSKGKYMKTACFSDGKNNYNEASTNCEKLGMNLISIESSEAQKSLFDVAKNLYSNEITLTVGEGSTYDKSRKVGNDTIVPLANGTEGKYLMIYKEKKSKRFEVRSYNGLSQQKFICEFEKKSPCISIERDISDAEGKYIKTACIVDSITIDNFQNWTNLIDRGSKIHDFGYNYCASAGMKMFVIDSADVQKGLFDKLQEKFNFRGATFNVDGRRNGTDHQWYYIGSGKQVPVFDGLDLSKNKNAPACLKVYNFNGTGFKAQGMPCATYTNPICEFVK
jgi:hypothetical protein